ncbi:hypothetical protein [Paenibacillus cymbidii]|uniref:hypothetical protein n=1 Tax=Paenibacillus cymbidii TaxID=1639034 RepID=UPI00108060AA|nr:hypothetical protein [Paenibacillus cymbidii]
MYQKPRFVLVRQDERLLISVSIDLSLEPQQILTAYSYRFKMEGTFREIKQVIGAFGYSFRSSAMPKLNRYRRKGEPDPLERVTGEQQRKRIRMTLLPLPHRRVCHVQCHRNGTGSIDRFTFFRAEAGSIFPLSPHPL